MLTGLDLNMYSGVSKFDSCITSKRFAVVVLTYNHPEISFKCLTSILDLDPLLSVFVVHNGSDLKNTVDLQQKFPQFKHLILEKNSGYTGGANFGLVQAFKEFSYVLFLTNDTELVSLPERPPQGFCSVTIMKRNTQVIDSIFGLIDFKNGKLKHLKSENEFAMHAQSTLYIPGTAFWIDRDTFQKLQGFDESFHTYWDDVDFSFRAHLQNQVLGYSKDTIVKHKIGKTCHKDDFYTYYLFQRNRKKFFKKHQLQSISFWLCFVYDIIKHCKYRFSYFWRIIHD